MAQYVIFTLRYKYAHMHKLSPRKLIYPGQTLCLCDMFAEMLRTVLICFQFLLESG